MNKQKLKELTGLSSSSIAKLGKGESVTTDALVRICKKLDCYKFRRDRAVCTEF